ncbi:MAG: hypothetical protein ACOVQ4_23595 [Flectobacillus sp.]|uniref:hypothetical protein n=1 Tax=Flectobacillus sp. TaxID=50419 RepID=UPI003B9A37BF
MADNLELNIDFFLNSPEIKKETDQAKAQILGIGDAAEQASQKIDENLNKPIGNPTANKGIIESLKKQIAEARKIADEATNETTIELANAKIQSYEKQLQRLSVIGKQGWDDMGKQIADAVEKPTGKIEKLQYLIQKYSDFVKKSDNQEQITKYNGKIQEAQNEVERLSNIGKEGFDALGNKIEQSGGALGKLYSKLNLIANIIPGLGIAGLLGLFLEPLMEYLSKLDIFKDKLTEVEITANGFAKALAGGGEYSKAVIQTEQLRLQFDLVRKGQYDSKAALEEYNKTIGTTTGQVKTLTEAEQALYKNGDAYVKMTLYKAAAQKILEESGQKAAEAAKKRAEDENESLNWVQKFSKYVNEKTNNFFRPVVTDWSVIAKKRREEAAKQIEAEAEPLSQIALQLLKKADDEAKKMGTVLGKVIEPPKQNELDKALNAAEALQRQVYEIQQEYTRKRLSKEEEEVQAVVDRFEKISKEVEKFNANPKNRIKVDGSALEQTKKAAIDDILFKQDTEKLKIELEKQKGLYSEYETFKKDFGETAAKERFAKELDTTKTYLELVQAEYNKLGTKSELSGAEKDRMTVLQKILQTAQLEQMKSNDAMLKSALEASKSYMDKLVEIERDYQQKRKILQENNALTKEREAQLDFEKNKAIDSAKDEALQKLSVYKKLNEDIIQLTTKQVRTQIEVIKDLLKIANIPAELRQKLETQLQNLSGKVGVNVDQSYLDELQKRYKELVNAIGSTDDLGNSILSEEQRKRIIQAITEIKGKIKELDVNGDGKVSFADKLAKRFEYLKGSSKEFLDGFSRDLPQAVGIFEQLGSAVGQFDQNLGAGIKSIGHMVNALGQAIEAKAKFNEGDILGGLTSATGVASFVFEVVASFQAVSKSIEESYRQAIKGEQQYQDLLKQRALDNVRANQTTYNGILNEYKLRKQQLEDFQKEYKSIMEDLQDEVYVASTYVSKLLFIPTGTYRVYESLAGKSFTELQQLLLQGKLDGRIKDLVERLVELEQKGYDTQKAMAELAQQMAEIFTGTTVDNLADSLLEMFKQGKTGVQDLADFFQQTMQNAALSIFKNKVLAESMDTFYKEFTKATMDGGLDQSKIANLKLLFDSLVQGANSQFQAIQQITGLNLVTGAGAGSSSSNTSVGIIQRSITEQTASELVGLQRSQYDLLKRMLANGNDNLIAVRQSATYLLEIRDNTANTVTELKNTVTELKEIKKNTKSSNSAYDNGW